MSLQQLVTIIIMIDKNVGTDGHPLLQGCLRRLKELLLL